MLIILSGLFSSLEPRVFLFISSLEVHVFKIYLKNLDMFLEFEKKIFFKIYLCPCFPNFFRTGQIDKIQLSRKFFLVFQILLFDINQEHTVTAGTVLIHICKKKREINFITFILSVRDIQQPILNLQILKISRKFLITLLCSWHPTTNPESMNHKYFSQKFHIRRFNYFILFVTSNNPEYFSRKFIYFCNVPICK